MGCAGVSRLPAEPVLGAGMPVPSAPPESAPQVGTCIVPFNASPHPVQQRSDIFLLIYYSTFWLCTKPAWDPPGCVAGTRLGARLARAARPESRGEAPTCVWSTGGQRRDRRWRGEAIRDEWRKRGFVRVTLPGEQPQLPARLSPGSDGGGLGTPGRQE